jgi:CysZ protein
MEVAVKSAIVEGRRVPSPLRVLQGALFIWNHRVLWKYAAAPLVISSVILGCSYYLLYRFLVGLARGFVHDQWYFQALYYVVVFIVALFLLVVFFFLFTRVASALAAPFNDLISEKTEQLIMGNFQETPFSVLQLMKDSGRAIIHSLRILAIYVCLLVLCLLLLLIPVAGGFLFTAATVLLSSYMFAYEYLGYPMDRRRFTFQQKKGLLRSRLRPVIGFGLGNAAVASMPVVNILFIPAAVAGGTILFLELDGGFKASPRSPSGVAGSPVDTNTGIG